MKSLRIRENPLGFYTFTGKYLTWHVQIRKKVILRIDVLSMVYNMTPTVLLYVAVEAGTKIQNGFCRFKLPCVLY